MSMEDPFAALGVRLASSGGTIGVFSTAAAAIELCVFDTTDSSVPVQTVPLQQGSGGVWIGESELLRDGVRYALRATGPEGPTNAFRSDAFLIDPYSRGLDQASSGGWRSVVTDESFDWDGTQRPNTPLDKTVVYEAHVKGISKLNPSVPEQLRGTYAGLAHPATIDHLTGLGVTAIELLPVHAFVSEQRLTALGLSNYWGYNTLGFFAPHAPYATRAAQSGGASAVLREFKGMVRLLHEAGIEVVLDVVFNHTAEEGTAGPTTSLRGIDNAEYYRQNADGSYIDVTGCGNTVDVSREVAERLVMDSLRYWANEVQVDGFRFDLAATLGRDASGAFTPEHPLLYSIVDDPSLRGIKKIAEPWDVGAGGWQTGNFPRGFSEWNDRYRDRVRTFWLSDIGDARANGGPSTGIGPLATRLAGSAGTFSEDRGPLASVNFITAHDGFTAADLVSYNNKHNIGNGENNRDGSADNHSFNFGAEGPSHDDTIQVTRRRAIRALLATLLFSSGVPMITAGDEFGRTQHGNNNAYCHDNELTWLDWQWEPWQEDLLATVRTLIALRRDNPALRPVRYARADESVPGSSRMDWFDASGSGMDEQDWQSPANRTLQYLVSSTPEFEEFNRMLLIVHGLESEVTVTLPVHEDVSGYTLLWDSVPERDQAPESTHEPGSSIILPAASMKLFRATRHS